MKHFFYTVSDPYIKKSIDVNVEGKTTRNIKTIISKNLKIAEDQFTIDNSSPDQQLASIEENFTFHVTIIHPIQDIIFDIQDEMQIQIKNSSSIDFHNLLKHFKNENSLFFSNKCIEHIELTIWGIQIPKDGFHFRGVPEGVHVKFNTNCRTITLRYDQKEFIFIENEFIQDAKLLIKESLGPTVIIDIYNNSGFLLDNADRLTNDKRYDISAKDEFTFYCDDGTQTKQLMDYFSTILDAKQRLAIEYSIYKQLRPENIVIYNVFTNTLEENIRLSRIKEIEQIRFFIYDGPITSLLVNFIFEKSNKVKYDNFVLPIENCKKISQISKMVSDNSKIKDKIILLLKDGPSKIEIDEDITLENIQDNIQDIIDDELRYVLYVKVVGKKIKSPRSYKPRCSRIKIIKPKSDDDDSDPKPIQKKLSKKNFRPTINHLQDDIKLYRFVYKGNEKALKLETDSKLKYQVYKIKDAFYIDDDVKIKLKSYDGDANEEIDIDDLDQEMNNFNDKIIKLYTIKNKTLKKYSYKTNSSDKIYQIKLDPEANIAIFKESISSEIDVDDISIIQVYYDGDILLDDVQLKSIDIGESILLVKILPESDHDDIATSESHKTSDDIIDDQHKDTSMIIPDEPIKNQINSSSEEETYGESDCLSSFTFIDDDLMNQLKKQLRYKRLIGQGATSSVYKVNHINKKLQYDENESKLYSFKLIKKDVIIMQHPKKFSHSELLDDDYEENEEEEEIQLDMKKIRRLFFEYEILVKSKHPNIIEAYGLFRGNSDLTPGILLEFIPFNLEDCFAKKSPLSLDDIDLVRIIYEISLAMEFIHSKDYKIIHRDLKPTNILINKEKHAKICDFGIATLFTVEDQTRTMGVGTRGFMAPELTMNKHYSQKVDIFSFGSVAHYILTRGEVPSFDKGEVSISKNINEFSSNLIRSCLDFEPEKRPSFEEIVKEITNNNFLMIDGIEDEIPKLFEQLGLSK